MFYAPMLLHKINEPFDDDSYITELKFDGIRLLLSKFNDKIRLYTRHGNEVSALFREIYENLDLPNETVLDGELIVPGTNGAPNFEAIMERFQSKKSHHFLQYCVFDIIYYNGKKVAALPLLEGKEIIFNLDFDHKRIEPVQWVEGENGIFQPC